jgi:hypothetical protein
MRAPDIRLREGMTICLEPLLAPTRPDGGLEGVFAFEEVVAITSAGCDVLSEALGRELVRAPA